MLKALEKSLGPVFGQAEREAWEHFFNVFVKVVKDAYEKEEVNENAVY